ncbi:MAG: D-erythrulose kinase [Actinobacteria bacterium 69-20]|jgi:dihydroxyacetone kinase|nr:dihydroxyacetone kinase family protein [Actinomycetota bacterium]OJV23685.1 MAG: D-erythrulose kinase [Actinobacteria bacterium 69-20]
MTYVFDNPASFTEDALSGFLDVYSAEVVGVRGGVVRATATRPGKVAVVVGGGSGHYPAFCGLVGPGFADGAVVGNIFTSPSADDAVSVGAEVEAGAGLVFITGNYAGDVMNFTQAQQRLTADGIDTRVLFVTDDIASAPSDDVARRRGIAGDFVVFKIGGAAAEAGYGIDDVVRIARHANDRTRTLGVAFDGCTMPGASERLFTVPRGKVGVGLGIHGEPGVSEEPLPTASALAEQLVEQVTAEIAAMAGHERVGAILNGLGATKYEELFVLWGSVARLLRDRGYVVVGAEVGELVTSLDMAGCSLTLVALDAELESLWLAPARTPAFHRGTQAPATAGERRIVHTNQAAHVIAPVRGASPAARRCAARTLAALEAMQEALEDAQDMLGAIDAVAGDGDHGRGMVKGIAAAVRAAREAAHEDAGVATLLERAGSAWAGEAGGTSGALWGAGLTGVGRALGDTGEITAESVFKALRAGCAAISDLGHAAVGDKTMIDALVPFVDALAAEMTGGASLADGWARAAAVATSAADKTADLTPRVGRARPLAERSIGTPDPGAISMALCLTAAADALIDRR